MLMVRTLLLTMTILTLSFSAPAVASAATGYASERLLEQQIDSPAQKIELNIPKGCYIVKVGSVVRKIAVR